MTRSTFKPRPEQMALYPDVSGNTINGLGDAERRQPSYVYWGNSPDDVAHGDVQRWFYTVDPGLDGYGVERARRAAIIDAPLTPLAETPRAVTEADFASFTQAGLEAGDFDKIGVAAFDPVWAFEGIEIGFDRPRVPRLPNLLNGQAGRLGHRVGDGVRVGVVSAL